MEVEKIAIRLQRTTYDAAFQTEAIRRVNQDRQAAPQVAQMLGMSKAVLGKWMRAFRTQVARPAGSEAMEQENNHLMAHLARAETKRDICKTLTIFLQPTGQWNASLSLLYALSAGPYGSVTIC